jgi:hypothetical protein
VLQKDDPKRCNVGQCCGGLLDRLLIIRPQTHSACRAQGHSRDALHGPSQTKARYFSSILARSPCRCCTHAVSMAAHGSSCGHSPQERRQWPRALPSLPTMYNGLARHSPVIAQIGHWWCLSWHSAG